MNNVLISLKKLKISSIRNLTQSHRLEFQIFIIIFLLISGFLLNVVYSLWIAPLGRHETFVLETEYTGEEPQDYFFGDAPQYISLAINLKEGKGFVYPLVEPRPTTQRMPGFPLFLSWIFSIFGARISIALLFQCLLLVGIFWVNYLLARMLFSDAVAYVSLIVMLLWPNLKFYGCAYLGSETLAILLFQTFIFCLLKGEKVHPPWRWFVFGIVWSI